MEELLAHLWVASLRESRAHAVVGAIDCGRFLMAACGHLIRGPWRGRNSEQAPEDLGASACPACENALGVMPTFSYRPRMERLSARPWVTAVDDSSSVRGRHLLEEAAVRVPALSLAEEPEWPIDDPEKDVPGRSYLPGTLGEPTRRAA
jgi:hypothetical protein